MPAEVTALAAAEPQPVREARAVPPAAIATKGIARREVAATVGPATARMGQVTDQGVYAVEEEVQGRICRAYQSPAMGFDGSARQCEGQLRFSAKEAQQSLAKL